MNAEMVLPAAPLSTAANPTLARSVYENLRMDILSGRWAPGRKLLMLDLKGHYGAGASPIREALNRLASEELVVHSDQRGFTVAQASASELQDLLVTRIGIESLAISQALSLRTSAWEEGMVLAFHRLSRTPRAIESSTFQENPEWESLHRAFHFSILAGCQSPLLLGFCERLYDRAYRFRQLAAAKAYKSRNELDEHRAIFDAVMAGQQKEAQALLASHYRRTASIFNAPA
jgi:DNA-binding GntR family transcriptional regulator